MGNTLEVIERRISCKKYQDKKVPADIVEKITKAGTFSATGMDKQSPVILVVENKEIRDRISKLNAAVMNAKYDPFYGAPQVLVVLADKSIPTYIYDGSLVMGNMMIAAEELGVGACWIHRAKEVFDSEEGKQILKDAGLVGDYEGIGNLVIGYQEGEKRVKSPRKDGYVVWVK